MIYTHGGGRFANQLLRLGHWIAWAEECPGREVINMAFWPFTRFLARAAPHPACLYPWRRTAWDGVARLARAAEWLPKNWQLRFVPAAPGVIHAAVRASGSWPALLSDDFPEGVMDLASTQVNRVLGERDTLVGGWRVGNWGLLHKHRMTVRRELALAPWLCEPAEAFLRPLRSQFDCIIGVHLRQTDYRSWAGGKFFFEANQYAQWLRQARDCFAGQRVGFVATSDEIQDPKLFADLPVFWATGTQGGPGHYLESMATLARCDALLGPPSTFLCSAATMGDVPLWAMFSESDPVSERALIHDRFFEQVDGRSAAVGRPFRFL